MGEMKRERLERKMRREEERGREERGWIEAEAKEWSSMQKSDRGMQSWAGISDTKSDGGKAARRLEGQQAFLYLSSTIPHLPFFFTYIYSSASDDWRSFYPQILTPTSRSQNEIYMILQQQYYQEKIQENRDLPTVEILDEAIPPLKAYSPRVIFSSVLGGIFTLMLVSLFFIIKEKNFSFSISDNQNK